MCENLPKKTADIEAIAPTPPEVFNSTKKSAFSDTMLDKLVRHV